MNAHFRHPSIDTQQVFRASVGCACVFGPALSRAMALPVVPGCRPLPRRPPPAPWDSSSVGSVVFYRQHNPDGCVAVGGRLRSGPSRDSSLIDPVLDNGQVLRVMEVKGDWVKVGIHVHSLGWTRSRNLSHEKGRVLVF